jgi:hypothetical protein
MPTCSSQPHTIPRSRLLELWALDDTELVTSAYAAAEAYRNLAEKRPAQLPDLAALLDRCLLAIEGANPISKIDLPVNDVPILSSAIASRCSHLLTGDKHFRPLFGRMVEGTVILRPGDYLRLRTR